MGGFKSEAQRRAVFAMMAQREGRRGKSRTAMREYGGSRTGTSILGYKRLKAQHQMRTGEKPSMLRKLGYAAATSGGMGYVYGKLRERRYEKTGTHEGGRLKTAAATGGIFLGTGAALGGAAAALRKPNLAGLGTVTAMAGVAAAIALKRRRQRRLAAKA